MQPVLRFAVAPVALLLFSAGCGDNSPQVGTNSNWLTACDTASECGVGACQCGLCTLECESDADCQEIPDGYCPLAAETEIQVQCGDEQRTRGICLRRSDSVSSSIKVSTRRAELFEEVVALDAVITSTEALSGNWSLRYYFTNEGHATTAYGCSEVGSLDCTAIARQDVPLAPSCQNADTVYELNWTGTLEGRTELFVDLQTDDGPYNFNNDYSRPASEADFAEATNVTLHLDENLVWGTEPCR